MPPFPIASRPASNCGLIKKNAVAARLCQIQGRWSASFNDIKLTSETTRSIRANHHYRRSPANAAAADFPGRDIFEYFQKIRYCQEDTCISLATLFFMQLAMTTSRAITVSAIAPFYKSCVNPPLARTRHCREQ